MPTAPVLQTPAVAKMDADAFSRDVDASRDITLDQAIGSINNSLTGAQTALDQYTSATATNDAKAAFRQFEKEQITDLMPTSDPATDPSIKGPPVPIDGEVGFSRRMMALSEAATQGTVSDTKYKMERNKLVQDIIARNPTRTADVLVAINTASSISNVPLMITETAKLQAAAAESASDAMDELAAIGIDGGVDPELRLSNEPEFWRETWSRVKDKNESNQLKAQTSLQADRDEFFAEDFSIDYKKGGLKDLSNDITQGLNLLIGSFPGLEGFTVNNLYEAIRDRKIDAFQLQQLQAAMLQERNAIVDDNVADYARTNGATPELMAELQLSTITASDLMIQNLGAANASELFQLDVQLNADTFILGNSDAQEQALINQYYENDQTSLAALNVTKQGKARKLRIVAAIEGIPTTSNPRRDTGAYDPKTGQRSQEAFDVINESEASGGTVAESQQAYRDILTAVSAQAANLEADNDISYQSFWNTIGAAVSTPLARLKKGERMSLSNRDAFTQMLLDPQTGDALRYFAPELKRDLFLDVGAILRDDISAMAAETKVMMVETTHKRGDDRLGAPANTPLDPLGDFQSDMNDPRTLRLRRINAGRRYSGVPERLQGEDHLFHVGQSDYIRLDKDNPDVYGTADEVIKLERINGALRFRVEDPEVAGFEPFDRETTTELISKMDRLNTTNTKTLNSWAKVRALTEDITLSQAQDDIIEYYNDPTGENTTGENTPAAPAYQIPEDTPDTQMVIVRFNDGSPEQVMTLAEAKANGHL